jgi:hypothetical protein
MPLLGFKRQFAQFVEDGLKTHTIRARRKRPIRVGETLHCYVDPRQSTMRLLGRFPCIRVQSVFINRYAIGPEAVKIDIQIDGVRLSWDEMVAFALRDGFRPRFADLPDNYALITMMEFWKGRLPFEGDLIHWNYTTRTKEGSPDAR